MIDKYSYLNNANAAFIDDLHKKYKEDPQTIDASWHKFLKDTNLQVKMDFLVLILLLHLKHSKK